MTTSLTSYRRSKMKSKSNNDICHSIVTESGANGEPNSGSTSNLRRISSDDLSDLAEMMESSNALDDGDNSPVVRKERNNRRSMVR